MTTNVIPSQGVTIARSDSASPEVYTTIADVMSIGGPSADNPEINVTSLSDTAQQYISGLVETGQVALSLGFDPTHATQQQIFTDQAAGSTNTQNYKITLTDSPQSIGIFQAWVKTAEIGATVDDKVTLNVTLRATSKVTWTWGS